jgi:hypothetical protein
MPFPKIGTNAGLFRKPKPLPNGSDLVSQIQYSKGFETTTFAKCNGLKTLLTRTADLIDPGFPIWARPVCIIRSVFSFAPLLN